MSFNRCSPQMWRCKIENQIIAVCTKRLQFLNLRFEIIKFFTDIFKCS